jgi:prophage tail gpP-like protein
MGPDGTLIIGKPNMAQKARGRIFLHKEKRQSNVLSMRVTRASTAIPNLIVPIWAGQETTVDRVAPEQALMNGAAGPARLYKLGHRVPKSVVVSTPTATDPQGLSQINAIQAAGGNLLQAAAKRELARRNVGEIVVEAVVPGHYDENGLPYVPDTVYHVEYDRGSVDESMYLYQVDYSLEESGGQRTNLFFCRLGAIVADVRAP